jgi:hypothetical protein
MDLEFNEKDLKKINIVIPNNLSSIKEDVSKILKLNETIIKKYLERIIYTSTLTDEIEVKIDEVFLDTYTSIIDNL